MSYIKIRLTNSTYIRNHRTDESRIVIKFRKPSTVAKVKDWLADLEFEEISASYNTLLIMPFASFDAVSGKLLSESAAGTLEGSEAFPEASEDDAQEEVAQDD